MTISINLIQLINIILICLITYRIHSYSQKRLLEYLTNKFENKAVISTCRVAFAVLLGLVLGLAFLGLNISMNYIYYKLGGN